MVKKKVTEKIMLLMRITYDIVERGLRRNIIVKH